MTDDLREFIEVYDAAAELAKREDVPVHDVLDRFFAFLQIRAMTNRADDELLSTAAFTD